MNCGIFQNGNNHRKDKTHEKNKKLHKYLVGRKGNLCYQRLAITLSYHLYTNDMVCGIPADHDTFWKPTTVIYDRRSIIKIRRTSSSNYVVHVSENV